MDVMALVENVLELSPNENISIYPNPVKDLANVEFNLEKQVKIQLSVFNQLGQKVYYTEEYRQAGPLNLKAYRSYRYPLQPDFVQYQRRCGPRAPIPGSAPGQAGRRHHPRPYGRKPRLHFRAGAADAGRPGRPPA